jgi:aerotaxis receptor
MEDMQPSQLAGTDYKEYKLTYFDGSTRRVLALDVEVPYPDGKLIVSRTDTRGVITHANQAFVEMSGYTEAELIGQPHAILRHPDMPAIAFKDVWDTLGQGKKWKGYVKNLRKDGAYYWVFTSAVANVRNGVVVGFTSVRRKPSRERINECIPIYADLRAKEI